MPQIFQVLRCYKCLVFQVHQTKKSNKFLCKLCGEKQSIKRHYGIGTAKDCRGHVQKLNGIRGEIDHLTSSKNLNINSEDEDDEATNETEVIPKPRRPIKSKWSNYVNNNDDINDTEKQSPEKQFLDDKEVVLEVSKKRKRNTFKCPVRTFTEEEPKYLTKWEEMNEINSNNQLLNQSYTLNIETGELVSNDLASTNSHDNDKKTRPDTHSLKEKKEYITKQIGNLIPKAKVSLKPPSNSKWAQFVEDENDCPEDDNTGADEYIPDNELASSSQELFALCNDSDLDNVLDI